MHLTYADYLDKVLGGWIGKSMGGAIGFGGGYAATFAAVRSGFASVVGAVIYSKLCCGAGAAAFWERAIKFERADSGFS